MWLRRPKVMAKGKKSPLNVDVMWRGGSVPTHYFCENWDAKYALKSWVENLHWETYFYWRIAASVREIKANQVELWLDIPPLLKKDLNTSSSLDREAVLEIVSDLEPRLWCGGWGQERVAFGIGWTAVYSCSVKMRKDTVRERCVPHVCLPYIKGWLSCKSPMNTVHLRSFRKVSSLYPWRAGCRLLPESNCSPRSSSDFKAHVVAMVQDFDSSLPAPPWLILFLCSGSKTLLVQVFSWRFLIWVFWFRVWFTFQETASCCGYAAATGQSHLDEVPFCLATLLWLP